MVSSLGGGQAEPRMQAPVRSVQRDRPWHAATRRGRAGPEPQGPSKRRVSFADVVVVVCFLVLVAMAVVGGVTMLLSWVTTTLPVSSPRACPELEGCAVPVPEESEAESVDDQRHDGPTLTR
jgi:hypothetical protein